MNKLMECKTCGKEIAKTAVSCPHCGAKYKNTLGDWILLLIKWYLILFFILGGISAIIGMIIGGLIK